MHTTNSVPALPQLHSADWRVRLREASLRSIVFEHVCSVQDASVLDETVHLHRSVRGCGATEWQGRCGGRLVSLGWDWLRLDDGALVPDLSSPPRSNILLIDSRGYDMDLPDSDLGLWQLIQGLGWQEQAAVALEECV